MSADFVKLRRRSKNKMVVLHAILNKVIWNAKKNKGAATGGNRPEIEL
jgi:hypothetical protein